MIISKIRKRKSPLPNQDPQRDPPGGFRSVGPRRCGAVLEDVVGWVVLAEGCAGLWAPRAGRGAKVGSGSLAVIPATGISWHALICLMRNLR